MSAAIIAHNKEDAKDFFGKKVRFAYDNLYPWLRNGIKAQQDATGVLSFDNGSSLRVTTSGRSGTYQMVHVCLSGETEVYTKHGFVKRIKEINRGDIVLTSCGYQPVYGLAKNRLSDLGKTMYSVNVFGHYDDLRLTEDHKVLTRGNRGSGDHDGVWKSVHELSSGDYIGFPIQKYSNKLRGGSLRCDKKRIEVNFDLGYFVGMFLAEGTLRKREITFSLHDKEIDKFERFILKFEDYFDSYRTYSFKDSKTSTITLNSGELSLFLDTYFHFDGNKYIPDSVFNYGRDFLDGLLRGLFDGDGCYKNVSEISICGIRRQILDQVKRILISLRFGYPRMYHRNAGEYYGRKCKETWTLKLYGPGNYKFREYFGLPLPTIRTKQGGLELKMGRRPMMRKFWRRGRKYYWAQVKGISECRPEEYVYDIVLEKDPHNYVTVNGVVHNSEFGKMCAQYPHKAQEVITGTLNTVHPGQLVTIESTAEGKEGRFYDMCDTAMKQAKEGRPLGMLDYKFHFFGAQEREGNRIDTPVPITHRMRDYFDTMSVKIGREFDNPFKYWYVSKEATQGEFMKREHPLTPEEAFDASTEGAYYAKQMTAIRKKKQICKLPYKDGILVHTFWDIGIDDYTAIWFAQKVGGEIHLIHYYENCGEGLLHYADYCRDLKLQGENVRYGQWWAPHDMMVREYTSGKTRKEIAQGMGINFQVGDQVAIPTQIQMVRQTIPICWFDYEECEIGISRLDGYRKEWNDKLGVWRDKPRHDENSHGASAFALLASHIGGALNFSDAPPSDPIAMQQSDKERMHQDGWT